jgi:hypothetical protein
MDVIWRMGRLVTPEGYYAEVKKLGLTPSTNVPTVFLDSEGMTYNVPSPSDKTSEQREEMIAKLKERLGVTPRQE